MDTRCLPFLIAGGLAILNLSLIAVWFAHHARLLRGQSGFFASRWSLLDIWFGFQLTLVCLIIFSLLLFRMFAPLFDSPEQPGSLGTWPQQSPSVWVLIVTIVLLQQGAMVGLSWALMRLRFKESWANIGLRGLPTKHEIIQGLIAGAMLLLILILTQLALSLISQMLTGDSWLRRITQEDSSSRVIQELVRGLEFAPVVIAGVFLFGVIIAPFCEELLFRGVVYNALKKRFGHGWAAPVSGAIFSFIHASVLGFIPRWIIGWLLANVYHRTGSLWVPFFAHALNNAFALLLLLRLSRMV